MEVKHELTKDKKLIIFQDTELNSFTFDSLLLANFASINKRTKKAIDLCAGNSPVNMLLTRKRPRQVKFTSVEIQKKVSKLGAKSVEYNNLENEIDCICEDLIGIHKKVGANCFDLVTCNPPYFKIEETSNLNPNESVAIARHELLVNLEQIIEEARVLLSNNGTFSLVFRPERLDELIVKLSENNFHIKRIQFVYPKMSKNCNTILVEAKKGSSANKMLILPPLFVYNEDSTHTSDALKIINQ